MKNRVEKLVAMMLTIVLLMSTFSAVVAEDDTACPIEVPVVTAEASVESTAEATVESTVKPIPDPNKGIMLLSLDIETTSDNHIMNIHVDDIDIGKSFEITWDKVDYAKQYEIAIVRINKSGEETYLTSGTNHRESTGESREYTVSASDVPPDTECFRIYIGAASKSYPCDYWDMLRDNTVTVFTRASVNEEVMDVTISVDKYGMDGANVAWGKVTGSSYYVYSVYDITDDRYIDNRSKTTSKNFDIDDGDVVSGHSYRIWVGAYDEEDNILAQHLAEVILRVDCIHEIRMDKDLRGLYYYEEISDTHHVLYRVYNVVCRSCEEVLEEELVEPMPPEKHEYTSEGVCRVCHYAGGECIHVHTHPVSTKTDYESENKNTHTMIEKFDLVCDYCEAVIPARTTDSPEERIKRTEGIKHRFVGGICKDCGYIKAPQLTVTVQRSKSSAKVGDSIGASASISGGAGSYRVYWKVYCDDVCIKDDVTGAWIAPVEHSADWIVDRAGDWYFEVSVYDSEDETAIDQTRIITVTESECEHDYQTVDRTDLTEYENTNDFRHRIIYHHASVCTLCEDVRNVWISDEFENHIFGADGTCVCGAFKETDPECVHKWNSTVSDTRVEETNGNDRMEEHKVTTVYADVCSKCGSQSTHETVEYVAHVFDKNGKCKCGYIEVVDECDHATTGVSEGKPVYVSIDDKVHSVTTYERHTCECGQVDELREIYVQVAHTFNGNTCSQCGYTKANELSVSVITGQNTAKVGDRISAEAVITSGSGNYSIAWSVMLDNVTIDQTNLSMGKSYNYLADQAGTYTFVVTVRDSDGTIQTVKSGAIVVAVAHNWEPVTDIWVVNQSDDFHSIFTARYDKCTICGEKTDPVITTQSAEHVIARRGYEEEHPHQEFMVCRDCTARPYIEGAYKTANGKVQSASECCICHGHDWSHGYQEQDQWNQKCNHCGMVREVSPLAECLVSGDKHMWTMLDGVCTYCKKECEHSWRMLDDTRHLCDICMMISEHVIGSYYTDDLTQVEFCFDCEPRTEKQMLRDLENRNRVIQKESIDRRLELYMSNQDATSTFLSGYRKSNESFRAQFGAYLYMVLTIRPDEVVKKMIPGSSKVDEIRKGAVQYAVAATLTKKVMSMPKQLDFDVEEVADAIATTAKDVLDGVEVWNEAGEAYGAGKASMDALMKVMKEKPALYNDFSARLGSELSLKENITDPGLIVDVVLTVIKTGINLYEFSQWNKSQKELFLVSEIQASESKALLEQLKSAYPDDKLLRDYCNEVIIKIDAYLTNDLVNEVRNFSQTAGEIAGIVGSNVAEFGMDFAIGGAAMAAGLPAFLLVAIPAATGFFIDLTTGTGKDMKTLEDIDIMYTEIENLIYDYEQAKGNKQLPDIAIEFMQFNILAHKEAALQMAGAYNKGQYGDVADNILESLDSLFQELIEAE